VVAQEEEVRRLKAIVRRVASPHFPPLFIDWIYDLA
jgi:hypothetical protein